MLPRLPCSIPAGCLRARAPWPRRLAPPTSTAAQPAHRFARPASSQASTRAGRTKSLLYGAALTGAAYLAYLYSTDTRASVHQWLVPPLLRSLYPDAEDAHGAGTSLMRLLFRLNLHPRERERKGPPGRAADLTAPVLGAHLDNPIGISAGLDKDGRIPDALFALGAGVVEIGGITPLPQPGNPRPRVFRVPALRAMVNRYGLNSEGADAVAVRLRDRLRRFARAAGLSERDVLDGEAGVPPGSLQRGRLLAVQVAKNKETDERDEGAVAADYVYCVAMLGRFADILVVNVSSPNTPGLRDLQAVGPLTRLLTAVVGEASRLPRRAPPKIMVKVSPDEDADAQLEGIVRAVHLSGVDGVIVGNTTKRRRGLATDGLLLSRREREALAEEGGFSGDPTFSQTLRLVSRYRKALDAASSSPGATPGAPPPADAQKVIFASGGITTGERALQVLNAGASVAMTYTGLVYGGAGTITRLKAELRERMRWDTQQ